MAAHPERIPTTSFPASSQAARYSRSSSAQPAPRRDAPDTEPKRKLSPDIAQRHKLHRSIVLNTVISAALAGAIGMAFLFGHIELANEAARSKAVTQRLFQANERSYYFQHRRAQTLTPSIIGKKAEANGMVKPDDRDIIELD